jgi:hypothetical protein
MGFRLPRWLWNLLHRGTIFVAVRQVNPAPPAAAQTPQRSDTALRLTAARFVH